MSCWIVTHVAENRIIVGKNGYRAEVVVLVGLG